MADTHFLNESLSSMWNHSMPLSHPSLSALITHTSWAWINTAVFASASCNRGWVQQPWGANATGTARQSSCEAGEASSEEGKQEVTHSHLVLRSAEAPKTFLHLREPPFWYHPMQTLAGNFCAETLTGRKSEAFRPMGSFLAAGITDGSVLVKGVEEVIGGLWTGSGCRRNWDKSSHSNNQALVWCSFFLDLHSYSMVLM